MDDVDVDVANSSVENEDDVHNAGLDIQKACDKSENVSCRQSKRTKSNTQHDELIEVLKKRIIREGGTSDDNDEDRLFLMSLVSEMHKVPAVKKLLLKSAILVAISEAQGTNQQCPQPMPYQGLSMYTGYAQPTAHYSGQNPAFVTQYSGHNPAFSGSQHYLRNCPPKSDNTSTQFQNSGCTSENIISPITSDSNSQMSELVNFDD